jgi:hypothetical protein
MRFVADENFNGKLLAGLRAALPDLDLIRVQDTEMYQASDPDLLEWAAEQERILLTHDIQTVVGHAYARVEAGLPMPGVIEVRLTQSIGAIVEDLVILISASASAEFENQVRYVPL